MSSGEPLAAPAAAAAGPGSPSEAAHQHGAGTPDAWQRLWSPHRMSYIRGESPPGSAGGCPFCEIPGMSDPDGLVVARGENVFAVLNLYPYNPGHLMVVPYEHLADFAALRADVLAELSAYTQRALRTLKAVSGAQGFNVGLNLGAVAGAGIAAHLHQHVVPRWGGDTNLMPVVGQTKVLPQLLAETRDLLSAAWPD